MKESIVFDLDGTLITCENKQKYALFSILNSFGYSNPNYLIDWWNLKRNGFNTETALIELGILNATKISNEWKRIIEDSAWTFIDAPFEDSISSLEYIKAQNRFQIFILTARKSPLQVFQTIQRFRFNEYIDDIIVVNPHNVVAEKAHYLEKIKPLLYIGDTELDYAIAKNSGTRFVALSRGQRSIDFLNKAGKFQIEQDLKFINKMY
jgi:phosphoglycolate phosphatase-like HAD superfamily hydrolase